MRRYASRCAVMVLACAATPPRNTLTLAEAKHLSPGTLARRLLGAAGAGAHYTEASVLGDGGIMIHQPGLNSVELYKKPISAGFAGLCQVEGVHIQFSASRYNAPSDPPHHVTDFWKLTRFAMLPPADQQTANREEEQQDRACARLAPVAHRTSPTFFSVNTDRPVDAYFAMRTLKVAREAVTGGSRIICKDHDTTGSACADAAATWLAIPLGALRNVRVERCAGAAGTCTRATWAEYQAGNETREIELIISTDASNTDPPSPTLRINSLAMDAGTFIDD